MIDDKLPLKDCIMLHEYINSCYRKLLLLGCCPGVPHEPFPESDTPVIVTGNRCHFES